jgi:hypothetical protein
LSYPFGNKKAKAQAKFIDQVEVGRRVQARDLAKVAIGNNERNRILQDQTFLKVFKLHVEDREKKKRNLNKKARELHA